MANDPLVLILTRSDSLTDLPCPLRADVRVMIEPPLDAQLQTEQVVDALEAAIGFGQSRYHIPRDEMPSRRSAVEEAARAALETTLAAHGRTLVEFALVLLVPAPGGS